jgi:hypothetical protein
MILYFCRDIVLYYNNGTATHRIWGCSNPASTNYNTALGEQASSTAICSTVAGVSAGPLNCYCSGMISLVLNLYCTKF